MEIITVSEPDCGVKPTGYAAAIKDRGFSELRKHIVKGLGIGWGVQESVGEAIAEDHDALALLQCTGFCWFREKWLVEVTEVNGV
jgi:hypothetical protein